MFTPALSVPNAGFLGSARGTKRIIRGVDKGNNPAPAWPPPPKLGIMPSQL